MILSIHPVLVGVARVKVQTRRLTIFLLFYVELKRQSRRVDQDPNSAPEA